MTDDGTQPTVPIYCPDCETTTEVELSAAADAVTRHNDQLHDGDDVAGVDPAVAEQFADLVADDLGLLDGSD